ncbi:hypothetical protein VTH06DRAFT_8756 [Thermothelomyces fergusii]
MGFWGIRAPTSLRLSLGDAWDPASMTSGPSPFVIFQKPPETHPSIPHLVLLVFGAVLEVVCVSLPGYIIARLGHFDAEKQKFLANLNVMLFTPCLIFIKLGSQLNADKLIELGIIPVIFVIQTFVSYIVSRAVARCFGFHRRASNFVTAMGVFGNSNSLPISLVISLSQTLKGLHWDKIPGDNDEEVAARGILYLLLFQQLGQLVRWSWGYHVLLAPKSKYEEYNDEAAEEGRYRDEPEGDADEAQARQVIEGIDMLHEAEAQAGAETREREREHEHEHERERHRSSSPTHTDDSAAHYEPAGRTPVGSSSGVSPNDSEDDEGQHDGLWKAKGKPSADEAGLRGQLEGRQDVNWALSFPHVGNVGGPEARLRRVVRRAYEALPRPAQAVLGALRRACRRVYRFLWDFMNPPLWAMLIAVFVASRDVRVAGEIVRLLAGRVGGHDDDGGARVRGRREVGVVHQRHVRDVVGACRQVQEAGVLEALHDFGRQRGRHSHVRAARRGLVAERYLLLHGGGGLVLLSSSRYLTPCVSSDAVAAPPRLPGCHVDRFEYLAS